MKNVSLRSQVFVIVTILAIGLLGAMIYVAETVGRTRESIIRFDRERLSALTDDMSRRYGSIMNFVAPSQLGDTALAERSELTKLLFNITEERLQNAPDVRAGFFYSLWNRQVTDVKPTLPGAEIAAADHYLRVVLQLAIDQRAEQWSHYETGGENFIIIAKPVMVRNRLVGAAWAVDDLSDEYAASRPFDVAPLFQIAIIIGILVSSIFVINLRREVNVIQRGLEGMKRDITKHLPESQSELGYIASSINGLADTIVAQQAEREALQQAIQHNEKMASLGQLIAGVAHEIRTPLSVIKTRIQLWQRAFSAGKTASKKMQAAVLTPTSMNLVVDELDRMERIVRKLLYFSKQRRVHFSRTNLHDLIESALATIAELTQRDRVKVTTVLSLKDPWVPLDTSEMKEVILNLFTNAIEAMPQGGDMLVTAEQGTTDSMVLLSVEDSGKHISPEVASRMFDPFFTTKETGTGLGLSICYEIVRAHHGTIEYSQGKKGSCFTISLPRKGTDHSDAYEERP
jgi:signal transduction histidine kinase